MQQIGGTDAIFSSIKWKLPNDVNFFKSSSSFQSESFQRGLITTRFSNATVLGSGRFVVAVGHPSDELYGKGLFGAVISAPQVGSETVESGSLDDILFQDPGNAPSHAYASCVRPEGTPDGGVSIVVFGGVSNSIQMGDGAATVSAKPKLWIFGIWESGKCIVRPGSNQGSKLKVSQDGAYEYGWFELPIPKGGGMPNSRSLCSLFAFSDGSYVIHGGFGGAGHQTDKDIEDAIKASKNQQLLDARSAVKNAHDLVVSETDPGRIAAALHIMFASSVIITADAIDLLRGNAGHLSQEYIDLIASTMANSETARTQSIAAYAQLAEAISATNSLMQYVGSSRETAIIDTSTSIDSIEALIKQRKRTKYARDHAKKLIEELKLEYKLDDDAGVRFVEVMTAAAPASLIIKQNTASRATLSTYNDAWTVNPQGNQPWTPLSVPNELTARYGAACLVSNDGKRGYAFGGLTVETSASKLEVWSFDRTSNAWTKIYTGDETQKTPLPLLSLRHAAYCMAPNDTIIVHGGFSSQCVTPSIAVDAEMSPAKFLYQDFGVGCPDGTVDRLVSEGIWVFSQQNSSTASSPGTWTTTSPLSEANISSTMTNERPDAFHSLFVLSSDDVAGSFILGVAGGVSIAKNVFLTPQKGIEDYAKENAYMLSEIAFEKSSSFVPRTYTKYIGKVGTLASPFANFIFNSSLVIFVVVWVMLSVLAFVSLFKTQPLL